MVQWTSRDHLLEQPVQLNEHIEQKQQQRSQIPMGQVALLDFFEPSSQRLPPSPKQTTVDDYEDDESTLIQNKEEESNQMQQQHPVEMILHSKFESNGQQKYLIRWMGDYKDSWQPKGNITSDIIEDYFKRKMQEMANKHLAKVCVKSFRCQCPFCCPCDLIVGLISLLFIRMPKTRSCKLSCIQIKN
jgi:hypothetical protein